MSTGESAARRTVASLQVRVAGLAGAQARMEARLDALENPEAQPSPEVPPDDTGMPSEAERIAMRERLRVRALEGIEANKTDRNRAGGPITRNGFDVA